MKVAMFSYNTFVSTEANGWKIGINNEILLIQNPEGRLWGATQSGIPVAAMATETRDAIRNGWKELASEIQKLDQLIIYVGSYGAEQAIEMAKEYGLSVEKLTFIMCSCGLYNKQQLINSCGYAEAKQIICECGGHSTMNAMYSWYLK